MKSVLLIRHAKSSWDDPTMQDFDRPLNERGKKDAPVMATHILKAGFKIDLFVSSPAKRALKTCKIFVKTYDKTTDDILLIDDLYHAGAEVFNQVIKSMDDNFKRIAIFSHNPGITDFVNSLNADFHIDNMPTCAVCGVKADIKNWKDWETAKKITTVFEYPSRLL
ncbi:MAG: histidine phosphatase family protein [Ferruginibacter sp.]